MLSYYSAIILLCWMALGALGILVRENDRIPRADKRLLYLTYALIAVSALAEWCGIRLDGRAGMPRWALPMAKCADFIFTPMAGGALVAQMRLRNRLSRLLVGLLGFNILLQIAAAFNGWTVTVDEHNHYSQGPLYTVYLLICAGVILLVILQFIVYGRSFRRQNRISLYATMLVVIAGIVMQEALEDGPKTSYLGMTLGVALMFIHYSEFSLLTLDDHLTRQQIQIDTDALTGVFSRYAYSQALKAYDAAGALPRDLAAFTIDVNGLKQVNDTLGHEAGDELICGAARCIERAMGGAGRCFRTGGDEFVVLASMSREQAREAMARLERETERWRGETVEELRLAAGCALAADHADLSAEKLVREADLAMYTAKAAYYRSRGIDRRHR